MKKTSMVTIILVVIMTITATAGTIHGYKWYKRMVKKQRIGKVREYYTEDLTYDILANRGDDIIIERIIGKCIDKKGNGKVMGADPKYNYISYKGVKGVRKGDVVMTVCIYTPCNSYEDDICERFDYIIDRTR